MPIRISRPSAWGRKGNLPFPIITEEETAKAARKYEHLIIDCKARPTRDTLAALLKGCDFLILPTTPDSLAIDALRQTIEALGGIDAKPIPNLVEYLPALSFH
jgi:chromosome partitioning protein